MRRLIALAAVLAALLALAAACGGGNDSKQPAASPSASATASPARASVAPLTSSPAPDKPVYIAIGDSLSYGNGASDHTRTAFVPLVDNALGDAGLLNLGIPGYTSTDILKPGDEIDRAVAEIQKRKSDSVQGNEVEAVTLEIGGNDLLNLYFSLVQTGQCPSVQVSLQKPACVQSLQNALDRFGPNLDQAIRKLQQADSQLPIFLLTLYNPFSGGLLGSTVDQLGVLALEGEPNTPFPEGLNAIIRKEAQAAGVHLVETYPLFKGKAAQLIAGDFIHPNDAGYQLMANAVIQQMQSAGLHVSP